MRHEKNFGATSPESNDSTEKRKVNDTPTDGWHRVARTGTTQRRVDRAAMSLVTANTVRVETLVPWSVRLPFDNGRRTDC
jgi:hypothetical protein